MTYPISQQAIAFVRQRATDVMIYTCRIERVSKPTFDQETGTATAGSRETIYEGVCRVWEVASGGPVVIAEDEVTMQSTQLSIPWDTPVLPKRDDEVQILTAPQDPHMVGKRFVIDSSAKAGEMRATRRFSVRGYN